MDLMPDIQVGDPIRFEALSVFPLFARSGESSVDYLLAEEAMAGGLVTVEEVGEAGSVPTLLAVNESDARVLFLEGEELRGAKQNRVLNTSILLAAHSKTPIPVSCVEQGRWRYRSRQFGSGGHSSSKLRRILKESVTRSTREGQGHTSDQGEVWREVSRQMASLGSASDTMAMADTYEAHRTRLDEYQRSVSYAEGATGLAVAVGPNVVALDLFDKPASCRKAWDRLLSGFAMDALEAGASADVATKADVEAMLARLRVAPWQQAPAVGEGSEYRADAPDATHASALVFGGVVVHGSAVVGV